MRAER
jgi:hypothetical protein